MKSCPICGSQNVIPDASVTASHQHLKVVVKGNPQALVFKDPLIVDLKAQVCGECGHVEFKAADPKALYRRYKSSIVSK